MGKKVIGLAVTVALLMVVLSGCFLLPKPDTTPPTVAIIAPQNGVNIVVSNGKADVTVKASVVAHSPIQGVTFVLTSSNLSLKANGVGPYGQTSGTFVATFTDLEPGSYTVNVEARSEARVPGYSNARFEISQALQAPVIGDITVKPNYEGAHYVTNTPITFYATVTNPNNTGDLAVQATVNGNPAKEVSSANGLYEFSYTPVEAGNYVINITATLNGTLTSTKKTEVTVDNVPSVDIISCPDDYTVATQPISFTFKATNATAYLDINGSTYATYTSASEINSYLTPDKWNTVTLTFKDGWGNPLSKSINLHILGVKTSNPNDTPYVFLIDKAGHVVNTNDWILKNAGDEIDLYGYILQGKNPISSYQIDESYYKDENLSAAISNESGTILSTSGLSAKEVPLRLVAYLFNTSEASHVYVKFNITVNNSAIAFLRYDVSPISGNFVSYSVSPVGDTYEGVPAVIDVNVTSKQPLTSITVGQPFKVDANDPFYGYSATTAYYCENSKKDTNTLTFTPKYVVPVSSVEASGIAAYGTASGTFPFKVAFYGPSGTYQIGATVTSIANQSAYATTTYKVQADTAAPTIKIENSAANSVEVDGKRVYYGPMSVTATITDDHAIYWAKFESENASITNPLIVELPNDANISNYGSTTVTTTATVDFTKTGPFTIWAMASDKHFDPTYHHTGNTANSVMSISGIYDNNAPTASLVGGKYDIDATSEYYSFTIEATDGNGVGLANTADVIFTPVNGGTPTTVTAQLDPQTPGYYKVLVNTDKLDNVKYSVAVTVMDKLYGLITNSTLKKEHETTIETGYITVHHNYPNVSLFVENTELSATSAKTISTDVFKIRINDPQFPWDWIDNVNYKNYVKITLAGPNEVFEPKTTLLAKYHTPGSTVGYLEVEVPEIYLNDPATTTNAPATVTMQVDVYDNVQPDKALFGRATGKFIPAEPLFTSEPVVTLGSGAVAFGSSTPVVAISNPSDFDVQVALSGLAQKEGMEITFYANGVKVGWMPASNGSTTLKIPINPDWQNITLTAIYAPSATVTYTARAADVSNYYSYSYKYTIGTFRVLGDTIAPSATITANGITANGSTVIDRTNDVELTYMVNGVAFYRHDELTKYYADLNNENTTINGKVTLTTANGQTVFATATLGATDLLSATAADFTTGPEYEVFANKLSNAASAGIYNISFTAVDPFRNDTLDTSATVVVDLAAPVIDYANADVVPPAVVPAISDGSTLTFKVTDDTGVNYVEASIEDLIYGNSKTQTLNVSATGIKAFSAEATDVVELPAVFASQFQNLPYVLTINAEDIAGRMATEVTRLFVTNVDHSPYVAKIIAVAANKVLVRLTEPMWVENFKLFTAYSDTYGGTITSTNIAPANILATYNGGEIANEFYVTFNYNIWTSSQINSDIRTDLYNVEMSSNTAVYEPIEDLAGNRFAMPINTTVPPTLIVTPASTVTGKGWTVTFTVSASSVAGIQKIVGGFNGQTQVVYAATGTMTFTAPTLTGTYTAEFTAYDNSVNQNTTVATAEVFVNGVAPIATLTVPATANTTFTATVDAVVGNGAGANDIASVTINGTSATYQGNNVWTATLTAPAVSGPYTVTATVVDKYDNVTVKTKDVYVDVTAPTITVKLYGTGQTTEQIFTTLSETTFEATVYTKNTTTGATFTFEATDNSATTITLTTVGTENTQSVQAWSDSATGIAPSLTENSNPVADTYIYAISNTATDQFGNKATFDGTVTVIVDDTAPSATITSTPLNVGVDTSVATVDYQAYDNGDAGLINNEAKLVITNGAYEVATFVARTSSTATSSVDVIGLLTDPSLNLVGNSATVTITLYATDNAGNSYSTSTTLPVDFEFKVATITREDTVSGSPIVIKFNTVANTSNAFVPSDIKFVNSANGLTYDASVLTAPNGTTAVATITEFVVEGSGASVSSANMPTGAYSVSITNIVGATPTTSGAAISNIPYPANIQ